MQTELLAPAKDKETAILAINCGADAVYIGAPAFGARKNAANSAFGGVFAWSKILYETVCRRMPIDRKFRPRYVYAVLELYT